MKASELKGKKVIAVPAGDNLGTVEDVLLRPGDQRLGALIVKAPGLSGPQVLMAEDINSIGWDTVPVNSPDKLQDRARVAELDQMVSLSEAGGRKVATVSGNYAGELTDVHLDPATGKITGYEVAGGMFARMFGKSHTIVASEHTSLGKDLLIVADEVIPAQTPEETKRAAKL